MNLNDILVIKNLVGIASDIGELGAKLKIQKEATLVANKEIDRLNKRNIQLERENAKLIEKLRVIKLGREWKRAHKTMN